MEDELLAEVLSFDEIVGSELSKSPLSRPIDEMLEDELPLESSRTMPAEIVLWPIIQPSDALPKTLVS